MKGQTMGYRLPLSHPHRQAKQRKGITNRQNAAPEKDTVFVGKEKINGLHFLLFKL